MYCTDIVYDCSLQSIVTDWLIVVEQHVNTEVPICASLPSERENGSVNRGCEWETMNIQYSELTDKKHT